jgi:hypothetical protein
MYKTKTPAVLEHVNLTANVFVKAKKSHIDSSKRREKRKTGCHDHIVLNRNLKGVGGLEPNHLKRAAGRGTGMHPKT